MQRTPYIIFWVISFLGNQAGYSQTMWTGKINNEFNTRGNWDNGLPTQSNYARIEAIGANVIMSGSTPVLSHLYVGVTGASAILIVSQDVVFGTTGNTWAFEVGTSDNDSVAVVNHTAGKNNAQRIVFGGDADKEASNRMGTYNFSGGIINLAAPDGYARTALQIGQYQGYTAVLNLSGGGTLAVGGKVKLNRFEADSTLNVTGGNLKINFNDGLTFAESSLAKTGGISIINTSIDGTGFSTINVIGDVQFGTADKPNNINSCLNLGSGYVHTPNATYTILRASGSFTGHGVFTNVSEAQKLTVGGKRFRANYVTGDDGCRFVINSHSVGDWSATTLHTKVPLFVLYPPTVRSFDLNYNGFKISGQLT